MHATVDLVYFNAGGGHRASASAVQAAIREQGWPWQVRLVNLFQVLDPGQWVHRRLGFAPEDLYNRRLASGRTRGMRRDLRVLQAAIRLAHRPLVRRIAAHWGASRPDVVVSLVPNFNRCQFEALARACPGVPYVTLMTDMADYPPHFWIERDQAQHVICGSERAARQAREAGYAAERVHRTSGMVLHPDFYKPPKAPREQAQRALGLDPSRPVGLVMFGGHGARPMRPLAIALPDVQLILMCGHNGALADELVDLRRPAPHAVVGFTTEVHRYMALADFFVGKPGPGCLSEAVQSGLPVVTFANAATIPQEAHNAEWVRQQRLGVVADSIDGLPAGVERLLADLDVYRARARGVHNQAVFEVPHILADILRTAPGTVGAAAPMPVAASASA